jgi:hypothetical protein
VRLLAPHLTSENHRQVLESACGKKKGEVEEIVARLCPRPDFPAAFRRLPAPRPVPSTGPPGAVAMAMAPLGSPAGTGLAAESPVGSVLLPSAGSVSAVGAVPGVASNSPGDSAPSVATGSFPKPGPTDPHFALPPLPASVPPLPLSPDRYRVQFTIGGETLEKLRLAKDMLRHAIPFGDEAAILDRALSSLLVDLARKKFAATDQPRGTQAAAPGSRHIPAEVKRAVWLRDLGICAFVGTNGRRCGDRAFVEFHHLRPYAVGGEATVENVQLRCRRHNDYEARLFFGQDGIVGRDASDGRTGPPPEEPRTRSGTSSRPSDSPRPAASRPP